ARVAVSTLDVNSAEANVEAQSGVLTLSGPLPAPATARAGALTCAGRTRAPPPRRPRGSRRLPCAPSTAWPPPARRDLPVTPPAPLAAAAAGRPCRRRR